MPSRQHPLFAFTRYLTLIFLCAFFSTVVCAQTSPPSARDTATATGVVAEAAHPPDSPKLIPEVAKEPSTGSAAAAATQCVRTVSADVVALPQPIMLNRLGAAVPDGLIFALKRDTVPNSNPVQLKPGKRPRPLVLRANVGDCLKITLTNSIPPRNFGLPAPSPTPTIKAMPPAGAATGTQEVSLHVQGIEWVNGTQDDGSFVGKNNSSLASASPAPSPMPPQTQIYRLFAKEEGTFLLYTMGDSSSGEGMQIARGLFGALNVQPAGAEWYRSQVTADDLALATTDKTSDNHPIINYGAKYADGTPVLKMLDDNNNIVHSDLTAIITGPKAGRFPGRTGLNNPEPPCNAENKPPNAKVDPLFCANPASPDRKQPYREVTIIYHEVGAVATQAFPAFYGPLRDTLNAGFDGFAINYGTGGIGAEVYANRIGVGPMGPCVDCKFEEFFLSAWSVGDPAMLVDNPANSNHLDTQPLNPTSHSSFVAPCATTAAFEGATPPTSPNPNCANARQPVNTSPYTVTPLVKATKAFFPDDPSNVYHSYINDHIKFRILHGGTVVTHVHHQHAHQWLQSPNSDQGSYLDSQMISPGASYTLEMVYNGSGNRNKVVGDSIFHCHFYPHFAAGMWAMWRTHDVFESGSQLANGIPVKGTRALPDGEIKAGTPTPAVVPLPTLPMAPLPSPIFIDQGQVVYGTPAVPDPSGKNVTVNPGFPFFIPGIAGARAPHPPFDFAPDGVGGFMDGGLPRHVVNGGSIAYERHDQFDWSKDLFKMNAIGLPEDGTKVEKTAIGFFSKRCHQSFFPNGVAAPCVVPSPGIPEAGGFVVNGLPLGPQPGAPFADPAVKDDGTAVGIKRTYKAAAIQLDVTFNKKAWHFPQQRILTLWNDVGPTLAYSPGGSSGRQPEPLFFRGNTGDIIEYWHTNLVPNYYLVDDFQVRTPTDILGQHIHLVKFDVTSSDGAGNGFNYEDGTFSPQEVQEMIKAINEAGGLEVNGVKQPLANAKLPPKEILDCTSNPGDPRCALCPDDWTPTHRPQCQSWMGAQTTIQRWYLDPLEDNSGVDRTLRTVFTHDHFGPSTHQQAGLYAGLLVEPRDSIWRNSEDGTIMGRPATLPPVRPDGGPTSWKADILTKNKDNQDVSYREFALEFQDLQLAYAWAAIGAINPKTQPNPNPSQGWRDPKFAINASPTPRLVSTGNLPPTGTQSVNYLNEPLGYRVGEFGDLSYAYDSSLKLAANLPPNGDPITPLMRAYQNDSVQVRVLVGAHVFAHQFNLEGPTWFAEPSWKNSGYRSAQAMGLSEHFELLFNVPSSSAPSTGRKCPDGMSQANCTDYLYSPSLDESGIANGLWGLFRAYDPTRLANKLQALPNNPIGPAANVTYSTCPANSTPRVFNITAVTAQKALAIRSPIPGQTKGQLVFNDRGSPQDLLSARLGVMYVRSEDLDGQGLLKSGVPIEPLILRANAGDCIEVNLTNALAFASDVFSKPFHMAAPFNKIPVQDQMSGKVGLHPQLLSYDGAVSNGINVGWNRQGQQDQVVSFGHTIKYQWYAGKVDRPNNGNLTYTPVEFGALNLFPSDPVYQHINGLFGAMIIEPQGSTWKCGEPANLAACDPVPGPSPAPPSTRASATVTLADNKKFREFALMISDTLNSSNNKPAPNTISSSSAVNYRTEPMNFRYAGNTTVDFSCMLSNLLIQPTPQDPKTPIFSAEVGDQVRFRMTHPFGTGTSQVFTVHGHVWQRNPYKNDSQAIGDNDLSQWLGSRDNHGSTDHFDLVIDKAGGEGGQAGDYLYTAFLPSQAMLGAWGIFRVGHNNVPLQPNAVCKPILKPGYVPPEPKSDLDRFIRQPINTDTNP